MSDLFIQLQHTTHRGQSIVLIGFRFHAGFVAYLKKMPGIRWSRTHKSWYQVPPESSLPAQLLAYQSETPEVEIEIQWLSPSGALMQKGIKSEAAQKPSQKAPEEETHQKESNEAGIGQHFGDPFKEAYQNWPEEAHPKALKFTRAQIKNYQRRKLQEDDPEEQLSKRGGQPNFENQHSLQVAGLFPHQTEPPFWVSPPTGVGASPLIQRYPERSSEDRILFFVRYLEVKRYSKNTIKTYSEALRVFITYDHKKPINELTNNDVQAFMSDYVLRQGLSFSYQNQFINAIKLYFKEVEKSTLELERLERPRRQMKLPNVLSKEEVRRLLESVGNMKHRTMLSLIYACGLRRRELLFLKPSDVLAERHQLRIEQSKNRKDRMIPISDKVIQMLRDYFLAYRPKVWLFEGMVKGEQYSEGSLQAVMREAVRKSGVNKEASLHWLRHSYATHLMETGTDTRYVQALLGHASIKTTQIYTHITQKSIENIRSPFDDL